VKRSNLEGLTKLISKILKEFDYSDSFFILNYQRNNLPMAGLLKNLLDLLKSNNRENIALGLELAKNHVKELQQRFGIQPQDCDEFLRMSVYKVWNFKTHLSKINDVFLIRVQLKVIPSFIYSLDSLTKLDLHHNELRSLPSKIGELQTLEKLVLSNNYFVSLPAEIGLLRNMKELNFSGNNLENIPIEVGQLQNLKELSLWYNHLRALPAEIGQLQNLQKLYLGRNLLQFLPTEIGQLQNLQVLVLEDNKLETIPSGIGELQNLRVLNLKNNDLKTMPMEIGLLEHLEFLDLGNNQLKTLPKELKNLKNCDIYIGGNPELVLPEDLQGWENMINMPPNLQPVLELLESDDGDDRDSALYNKTFDEEFQQYFEYTLPEYKKLMDFLIENELWDFRTSIDKIEKLSMYGLGLDELTPAISLLRNLKRLDLRNNFFKTLPKELRNLTNCKIYVSGNHNLVLPEELQGWENIIR